MRQIARSGPLKQQGQQALDARSRRPRKAPLRCLLTPIFETSSHEQPVQQYNGAIRTPLSARVQNNEDARLERCAAKHRDEHLIKDRTSFGAISTSLEFTLEPRHLVQVGKSMLLEIVTRLIKKCQKACCTGHSWHPYK